MIPLVDLRAQYGAIKNEVDDAVGRVLASGQFVSGKEVAAFEAAFAAYCGVGNAVAVNSGTSALHLALLAVGVGPGDEVITVPFTFVATAAAIEYAGARPVFVDIDPRSYTLDPELLERAITPRTRAVMVVHLYGQPADMDPILAISRRHGLAVIEDAAQAHGAAYRGRPVGALGDLACFSFYPGKNLGAYGEGGMVVTGDAERARRIAMLRDWGQDGKYRHVARGFNYRMDELQGAILTVKLRHLDSWTDSRRLCAARYARLLDGHEIAIPQEMPYAQHVYHLYAVRVRSREVVRELLLRDGIHTGVHYPTPVHVQEAYRDLGYCAGDFPHAEQAAAEVLSLPMYPELSEQQVQTVCAGLTAAVRREVAA